MIVTVPSGVAPGERVRIFTESHELVVVVPEGLNDGDEFLVLVPEDIEEQLQEKIDVAKEAADKQKHEFKRLRSREKATRFNKLEYEAKTEELEQLVGALKEKKQSDPPVPDAEVLEMETELKEGIASHFLISQIVGSGDVDQMLQGSARELTQAQEIGDTETIIAAEARMNYAQAMDFVVKDVLGTDLESLRGEWADSTFSATDSADVVAAVDRMANEAEAELNAAVASGDAEQIRQSEGRLEIARSAQTLASAINQHSTKSSRVQQLGNLGYTVDDSIKAVDAEATQGVHSALVRLHGMAGAHHVNEMIHKHREPVVRGLHPATSFEFPVDESESETVLHLTGRGRAKRAQTAGHYGGQSGNYAVTADGAYHLQEEGAGAYLVKAPKRKAEKPAYDDWTVTSAFQPMADAEWALPRVVAPRGDQFKGGDRKEVVRKTVANGGWSGTRDPTGKAVFGVLRTPKSAGHGDDGHGRNWVPTRGTGASANLQWMRPDTAPLASWEANMGEDDAADTVYDYLQHDGQIPGRKVSVALAISRGQIPRSAPAKSQMLRSPRVPAPRGHLEISGRPGSNQRPRTTPAARPSVVLPTSKRARPDTDRPSTTAAVSSTPRGQQLRVVPHTARPDLGGRGPAARQTRRARYVGMGGFGQRVSAGQRLLRETDPNSGSRGGPGEIGSAMGNWRVQSTGFYGCTPHGPEEDGPPVVSRPLRLPEERQPAGADSYDWHFGDALQDLQVVRDAHDLAEPAAGPGFFFSTCAPSSLSRCHFASSLVRLPVAKPACAISQCEVRRASRGGAPRGGHAAADRTGASAAGRAAGCEAPDQPRGRVVRLGVGRRRGRVPLEWPFQLRTP